MHIHSISVALYEGTLQTGVWLYGVDRTCAKTAAYIYVAAAM